MTVEAMFDRCGGFPNSTFRKSKSDLIFFHGIDAGRLHFCQLITLHFSMDYSTSCGSFESFLSYSPTFTATLLMSCVFPSSSTLQQRIWLVLFHWSEFKAKCIFFVWCFCEECFVGESCLCFWQTLSKAYTQCAAVTTQFFEMILPPQKWKTLEPTRWPREICQGKAFLGATLPPTILSILILSFGIPQGGSSAWNDNNFYPLQESQKCGLIALLVFFFFDPENLNFAI